MPTFFLWQTRYLIRSFCLPSEVERAWSCFATSVLWQTTCFSLERLMAALTSKRPRLLANTGLLLSLLQRSTQTGGRLLRVNLSLCLREANAVAPLESAVKVLVKCLR